jgi:hypothetical protein
MRTARKNHLLLYAMRFITGLNDNFSMVKSQILLMDPLPPMNRIFSTVLQYERQGNFAPIAEDQDPLPSINSVNGGKSKIGYSRHMNKSTNQGSNFNHHKPRVCTFCGRSNHTVETCYKKHGYPPHLQRNYNGSQANHASVENDVGESSSQHESGSVATTSITPEQYEKLMSLL